MESMEIKGQHKPPIFIIVFSTFRTTISQNTVRFQAYFVIMKSSFSSTFMYFAVTEREHKYGMGYGWSPNFVSNNKRI